MEKREKDATSRRKEPAPPYENIEPHCPLLHNVSTPRCSDSLVVLLEHVFSLMESGMLEEVRHWPPAYRTLGRSPNRRLERRIAMTKRQMAFGVTCFLVGILVGMQIAGNLDVLVGIVIIVAILLLCVYLVLPSLSRRTRARPRPVQRVPQRRTQRKP
jgi:hypothetical protein